VHLTYIDVAGGFTSNIADIYIDVNAAPAPAPLANPDFYSTPQDTVLVVDAPAGLLANDVSASQVNFQDDATGEILVNVGGDFTYYPAAGFVGTKTFSYTMTDGTDTSNLALVTIDVTASTISVIPSNPIPGNPADTGGGGDSAGSELTTLAYTGTDDVTAWLIAPAVALVALGGLGIWFARRRTITD
jgi:lysozyme family protein